MMPSQVRSPMHVRTTLAVAFALAAAGPVWGDPQDPLEFERARAKVVRSAVAAVEQAIVTIETVGGAQPLAESDPSMRAPPRPERPGRPGRPERPGRRGRPGPGAGGPRLESFRLGEGPTTGLVITRDGLILTSSINFARKPSVVTVTFPDGRRFVARQLGVDYIRRLALIRIEAADLAVPEWADPGELRVGQYAVAAGRGLETGLPHASLGIISALRRRNGNAVQTDAKTSPINYGGALLDLDGRVIGLIVPMAGAGGALAGAQWYDSGIGFAVTRDRVDAVLDRLIAGEIIEPGKIGVVLEPDTGASLFDFLEQLLPGPSGVRIREVAGNSPAAQAKLQAGDRITAFEGVPISDVPELQRRLSDRAAGETIRLSIKRTTLGVLFRMFDVELTLARAADISGYATEQSTSPAEGDPAAPSEDDPRQPDDDAPPSGESPPIP